MTSKPPVARPKVREPQRAQATFRFEMPEDALPPEHPARVLWTVLGAFDLAPFLADVRSAEHAAGRSELSPRMKLTRWLYAIREGIGSAHKIATRTTTDLAFRWIVGDLTIGHHALSAFRAAHGAAFEALFTDVVSALMQRGLIDLAVLANARQKQRPWSSRTARRTSIATRRSRRTSTSTPPCCRSSVGRRVRRRGPTRATTAVPATIPCSRAAPNSVPGSARGCGRAISPSRSATWRSCTT